MRNATALTRNVMPNTKHVTVRIELSKKFTSIRGICLAIVGTFTNLRTSVGRCDRQGRQQIVAVTQEKGAMKIHLSAAPPVPPVGDISTPFQIVVLRDGQVVNPIWSQLSKPAVPPPG